MDVAPAADREVDRITDSHSSVPFTPKHYQFWACVAHIYINILRPHLISQREISKPNPVEEV